MYKRFNARTVFECCDQMEIKLIDLWRHELQTSCRTQDAMITLLLGQNIVMTSFWRNNYVIIASCVHQNVL